MNWIVGFLGSISIPSNNASLKKLSTIHLLIQNTHTKKMHTFFIDMFCFTCKSSTGFDFRVPEH